MATIAEKIRALLAKADSTDLPGEARVYYAKAAELMVKYNIEEDALGKSSDLMRGTETFDHRVKWVWLISASAAKLMSCSVLMNDQRLCYFAGRKSNVEMAEEVFNHYVAQVEKYYKLALPSGLTKADRGTFRRNFKEGAADVIWGRVCEIVAHNTRALIVSPVQLEAEVQELTGVKPDGRTQAVVIRHNSVGTQAGRVAGHLVELGKEVKGH